MKLTHGKIHIYAQIALLVVAILIVVVSVWNGAFEGMQALHTNRDDCNVAGITIRGDIQTYLPPSSPGERDENGTATFMDDSTASEDVVAAIRDADSDPNIRGIFVEIDSPGGSPVAGEEIADALRTATKPTVALIRQTAASAAYWAATGAQKLFASKNSDVGSIGVTMSYVYETDPNKKYIDLSSAPYKDTGSPDKELTALERTLLLRDVGIIHDNFVRAVANNRGLAIEKVRAIADGSTVLGERAKELGLIDEIGSWKEAEEYLGRNIDSSVQICWY